MCKIDQIHPGVPPDHLLSLTSHLAGPPRLERKQALGDGHMSESSHPNHEHADRRQKPHIFVAAKDCLPASSLGSGVSMERRLAAIFAADVAGYSLLVRAAEAGTLARLRTHPPDL